MTISEAEIKEGDKRPKTYRSIGSKKVIEGKRFPGPRDNKEWNEVLTPDG